MRLLTACVTVSDAALWTRARINVNQKAEALLSNESDVCWLWWRSPCAACVWNPKNGSADAALPASALAVDCWDWPGAYPQIRDERCSSCFSNATGGVISTPCVSRSRGQPTQASATSPSLSLIIALDHLLSGVKPHSKRTVFHCQEKSESQAQLIAVSVGQYANI